MKLHSGIFPLTIGAACLVCLALFISPWSPSTQPAGFSLALDLDDTAGDQAISSLDVSPEQVVSVQIFAMDIQNATGISLRFGYDGTQVAYEGFDPGEALPERQCACRTGYHVCPYRRFVVERIGNGERGLDRHGAFSHQRRLFGHGGLAGARRACPGRRDRGNIARPRRRAAGHGTPFARLRRQWAGGVLGLRGLCRRLRGAPWRREIRGGVRSEQRRRYRLRRLCNLRLEFRRSGQPGARVRRLASGHTLRGREYAGGPAPRRSRHRYADADNDSLTYRLRGVHADRFSIGAGTGQLVTKEGIAYDHEARDAYTVTVRVTDGQGGRATVVVGIAVTTWTNPPRRRQRGWWWRLATLR